jgi:membrane protein required for colicin V production
MILDIIIRFNWVDIVVVIVLIRTVYIALKNGFPPELFKFLGNVLAIYLSFHYYTAAADFFRSRANLNFIPLEFFDFICFAALVISGDLVFFLFRQAFERFIKMQAVPKLNKFGGLVLGIFRAVLLVSLINFMLVISSVTYLRQSALASVSGNALVKVGPATYSWLWNSIMSKFMTKEKFNDTILEVLESIK